MKPNRGDPPSPLAFEVTLTPSKVVKGDKKEGVMQYVPRNAALTVVMASFMLVGLVQAAMGVHIGLSGETYSVTPSEAGQGSSLQELYRAYNSVKHDASKREQFVGDFHRAHSQWLAATAYDRSKVNYYATSVDAGPMKLKNERRMRKCSMWKVDQDGVQRDEEVDTLDWARDVYDIVPEELLPNSKENVMRLFGAKASGITAPLWRL
jgi:hypothetical protein